MIYLDNAATTGQKPISVIKAVNNALLNYSANPGRSGHDLSVRTSEEIYNCRSKIKNFFNASSENSVCFTYNCTHAINIALYGVLNEGDHVIISSLEHNAVLRPINYLKKYKNIHYDIADVDLISDEKTLLNFEKLIKKNTKMIFITASSNVIGRKLPVKQIGSLCKANNLLFGVDAAQAAGVEKIDIKDMNIDYLCIAPHKGFYSPTGVGILIAEKPIDNIIISGGTGVNSNEEFQPSDTPERIESGTVNIPAIFGVSAGIDFVTNKGQKRIGVYEMTLIQRLYKELKNLNSELYTFFPDQKRFCPVISFNYKGFSSEEIGAYLNKNNIAVRAGLHCSPLAHNKIGTINRGTVRVSPSIFNNYDDINKLIFLLKKLN